MPTYAEIQNAHFKQEPAYSVKSIPDPEDHDGDSRDYHLSGIQIDTEDERTMLAVSWRMDNDGRCVRWLFLPRRCCRRGVLTSVWRAFVEPQYYGGPGRRFTESPALTRIPGYFGGWLMEQASALDI